MSCQGDALNLENFEDEQFDVTLVLGPLYHLYDKEDVRRAIEEAIRVTKRGGILFVAFLSVYAILQNNYLSGNLAAGLKENFDAGFNVRHFEEQLFTGYDIAEFEQLFEAYNVQHLTTVAVDGIMELAEERSDFKMSDEEFELFCDYHLRICEKRELLGCSGHLFYICRKA